MPSTNAPPYGVLQVLMGMTLDSHYLQPMPPYGVLLLGKGRGILLPRAFNQRILYGVLLAGKYAKEQRKVSSTNAPSMGCFDIHITARPRHNTFNQRILYGVLPRGTNPGLPRARPSTNAPSMGCFP